ncbi:aldo/keto reductase [uncultured Sphaerochaeta sp.]|uniref:aldo/keto reductase n=1 Tax=uncultured Sphaerochaeta sp. TaxID=886478 RepID=UPI002A0A1A46|nr:aldo/keto reductase [uncultured Sphaerochaeta sp.]
MGCWQFGGSFGFWENQDRSDSIKLLHYALRSGIRHFDTAQGYGNGESEQFTGQQLKRFSKSIGREELTLATKILAKNGPMVRKDVETSLRRLCTDYIDILYLHWPSSTVSIPPVLDALAELAETDLVRSIGVSNFPLALLRSYGDYPIKYLQMPCNLLWIHDIQETQRYCKEHSIQTVGYSPLGLGILNGNHALAPEDGRKNLYCYSQQSYGAFKALYGSLEDLSGKKQCSIAQISLAWAFAQGFDHLLLGARTKFQLQQNIASKDINLSAFQLQELTKLAQELALSVPKSQDNIFNHRW